MPKKERQEAATKLISGGQSGVDRAVLDLAVARGLDYGGWCPKGGWAEDYPEAPGLLNAYPKLNQTPLADPAQRTEWNVRAADACMVLLAAGGLEASRGTALGRDLAARYGKPLLVVGLDEADAIEQAAVWLHTQREVFGAGLSLAIGGPRESKAAGIYAKASEFLGALLSRS